MIVNIKIVLVAVLTCSCKKERLSEMKSTVTTEIKSWSEVVNKNCASNAFITPEKD